MDKELFDDAIGEVPPSTVDVDAAIARGRRAARLRRVASPAVAAGVAVVLVTGAVAYTMYGDPGEGARVGAPLVTSTTSPTSPTSSTASTSPTTTEPSSPESPPPSTTEARSIADGAVPPPQCESADLETPDEAKARLTAAATAAVGEQRADVRLAVNTAGQDPKGTPHGPLEFYQVNNEQAGVPLPICDAHGYLMAVATTHAPEGEGNILFTVSPAYVIEGESTTCDAWMIERYDCVAATGPNGEAIQKTTFLFPGDTRMNRVEIVRQDGTKLLVQAENTGTSSKTGGAATSAAPPLTHEQLVAIGIDPDLTMFPE